VQQLVPIVLSKESYPFSFYSPSFVYSEDGHELTDLLFKIAYHSIQHTFLFVKKIIFAYDAFGGD
jgi:hypothetical protein